MTLLRRTHGPRGSGCPEPEPRELLSVLHSLATGFNARPKPMRGRFKAALLFLAVFSAVLLLLRVLLLLLRSFLDHLEQLVEMADLEGPRGPRKVLE